MLRNGVDNLYFTAPERLYYKEDPKRDACISLGRRNRKDFLDKLGVQEAGREEQELEETC